MRNICSVPYLMHVAMGCCGLLLSQVATSEDLLSLEPEPAVEAYPLTFGRQFVLFNQVLFGDADSPQLSIRYAYDPQEIQEWILDNANNVDKVRFQVLGDLAADRSDVMILPNEDGWKRSRSLRVIVDKPSAVAGYGQYSIDGGIYSINVPEWSIVANNDKDRRVKLKEEISELVFDLEKAIQVNALIAFDRRIEGFSHKPFVIEGQFQIDAAQTMMDGLRSGQ